MSVIPFLQRNLLKIFFVALVFAVASFSIFLSYQPSFQIVSQLSSIWNQTLPTGLSNEFHTENPEHLRSPQEFKVSLNSSNDKTPRIVFLVILQDMDVSGTLVETLVENLEKFNESNIEIIFQTKVYKTKKLSFSKDGLNETEFLDKLKHDFDFIFYCEQEIPMEKYFHLQLEMAMDYIENFTNIKRLLISEFSKGEVYANAEHRAKIVVAKDKSEMGRNIFFGGSSLLFDVFAQEVERCWKQTEDFDCMVDLLKRQNKIAFHGNVTLQQKIDFAKAIEVSKVRQGLADFVIERIQNLYFKPLSFKIASQFRGSSVEPAPSLKVLAYTCEDWMMCGGLGDRMKGLPALFYAAIGSNRIFHMDWEKPIDMSRFFEINNDWYDLPRETYLGVRMKAKKKRDWEWVTDDQQNRRLFRDFSSDKFEEIYQDRDSIDFTSNRLRALEIVFHNQHFVNGLSNIFPELADQTFQPTMDGNSFIDRQKQSFQVDYQLLASIALRLMFSEPQSNMTSIELKILKEHSIEPREWFDNLGKRKFLKIGLQIRMCSEEWNEGGGRVEMDQTDCFAEKVCEISSLYPDVSIVVFLTGDNEKALERLEQRLTFEKHTVINTAKFMAENYNATLKHLDRSAVSKNETQSWHETALNYIDWIFLTQMDFLFISRSGFAETASIYSMAPTWLFEHNDKSKTCPFRPFTKLGPNTFYDF